jgi:hypothetical protein
VVVKLLGVERSESGGTILCYRRGYWGILSTRESMCMRYSWDAKSL